MNVVPLKGGSDSGRINIINEKKKVRKHMTKMHRGKKAAAL